MARPVTEDLYFDLLKVKAKTLVVWGQDDRAGALDVGLFMLRRLARCAHAYLSALRPLGPCRVPRRVQSSSAEFFPARVNFEPIQAWLSTIPSAALPYRSRSAKSGNSGSNVHGTRLMKASSASSTAMMASIASPTGEERQLAHGVGRHHECQRHRRAFINPWMTIKAMQSVALRERRGRRPIALCAAGYRVFNQRGRRMSLDRRSIAR